MNATRYFEPATQTRSAPIVQLRPQTHIHRLRRASFAQMLDRSLSLDDVCDLIAAAGALTAVDIAGGLDVPVYLAANSVRVMAADGHLREDEFGRYRLAGECARIAS
ncbi:MAG: hypothetical protein WD359_09875 [Dehalococcoidia bacterium]